MTPLTKAEHKAAAAKRKALAAERRAAAVERKVEERQATIARNLAEQKAAVAAERRAYRFRKMPARFRTWMRDVFEPWQRASRSKRAAIVAATARRPQVWNCIHSPLCYSDLPDDFSGRAFVNFWDAVAKQRTRDVEAVSAIKRYGKYDPRKHKAMAA
jgi:hypothetical protein